MTPMAFTADMRDASNLNGKPPTAKFYWYNGHINKVIWERNV